jgi:O-antigen/teichoic acid export membrane protein
MHFTGSASAALIGQILINNSDILIVKHFFAATDAGQYAALALIGRVVFFATWSVVAVMFPIVAQRHHKNEPHHHLLLFSLGLVAAVSLVILAATLLFPAMIVTILFGVAYLSIAPLLWLYAITTMLYALANVFIHYRLSLNNSFGSWLAVLAGSAQIISLWMFHQSLLQVVVVQLYLMLALLSLLLAWEMWLTLKTKTPFAANKRG